LSDLDKHTCLSHPLSPWKFSLPGGVTDVEPKSRLICNDMEMLRKMTLEGFGIGAAPQILISEDIKAGSLITVLPDIPFQERTFYLVYPSRREPPSKVMAFIDFIFTSCQPIPPWEILQDVFHTSTSVDSAKPLGNVSD